MADHNRFGVPVLRYAYFVISVEVSPKLHGLILFLNLPKFHLLIMTLDKISSLRSQDGAVSGTQGWISGYHDPNLECG